MKSHSHFTDRSKQPGRYEENNRAKRGLITRDAKGNDKYPPEKVIPNKSLTPRDVIERFTRGLPVNDSAGTKPVWPAENLTHDSPDYNRLSMLDKQEKADLARSARVKMKIVPKVENPPKDEKVNPEK